MFFFIFWARLTLLKSNSLFICFIRTRLFIIFVRTRLRKNNKNIEIVENLMIKSFEINIWKNKFRLRIFKKKWEKTSRFIDVSGKLLLSMWFANRALSLVNRKTSRLTFKVLSNHDFSSNSQFVIVIRSFFAFSYN